MTNIETHIDLTPLPRTIIEPIVTFALREDFGTVGDITARLLVPQHETAELFFRARESGVIAGMQAAQLTFDLIDPAITFEIICPDGSKVAQGDVIARVKGPVRSLLMAERTALNFLTRLSGVATLTAQYVAKVEGHSVRIAATRKTTPGLRALEKQAVLAGGGYTHRQSLADAIMVKDNHIALAGGIQPALTRLMQKADHMVRISVEVDTLDQLSEVLPFHPHVILLDNMGPECLRNAVAIVNDFKGPRPALEASGGVNLDTVGALAQTGIDIISVGALTHSAPNFDIGLDANSE